jgi:hypothetical protein
VIEKWTTAFFAKEVVRLSTIPKNTHLIKDRHYTNVAPGSAVLLNRKDGVSNERTWAAERSRRIRLHFIWNLNLKREHAWFGVVAGELRV